MLNTLRKADESGKSYLVTPSIESKYVHQVYDAIAEHFSHTRHHPWPQVRKLLQQLTLGSIVADVGCGNGKYLGLSPGICMIGCDRSLPLLKCAITKDRCYNVYGSDALKIPLRDQSCDAAISIAVLHHISTNERRSALIRELARIVTRGGHVYIVAWAFEQDNGSRRQFEKQDVMVEWKLQHKYSSHKEATQLKNNTFDSTTPGIMTASGDSRWTVHDRYCHLYREGEIEALVSNMPELKILQSSFSQSNWCILLEKL